jgi:acetolactate synthase-1/3 small subunit
MKENTNIEQEKMDLYDDSEVALRTLSVLVENRPSVLSQVARLFTRNGYNIESIAAGATHTEGMTRLTIEFMATARQTTLLVNQLAKMVSVHSAKQLNPAHCIRRELALFKVRVTSADQRNEIIQIANIYRGSIIDVSNETLTVAVIGNEGKGISRLVREKCDFVVSIPMVGKISSLNASNAASILMYEVVRQRGAKTGN